MLWTQVAILAEITASRFPGDLAIEANPSPIYAPLLRLQ
jgi:hypothetical protein